MSLMTRVISLEAAGQSSQGTFEPITTAPDPEKNFVYIVICTPINCTPRASQ